MLRIENKCIGLMIHVYAKEFPHALQNGQKFLKEHYEKMSKKEFLIALWVFSFIAFCFRTL